MSRTISYTIDDPIEDGNVGGWVRKGYDEPDWVPTKLVSEARTRKRWAEVAKAYPEIGPQRPPVEPPQPGGTCIGDLVFDGRRWEGMDAGAPPAYIYARFVIPTGFDGKTAQISFSEHGSTNRFRTVVFSQTAGDFSTPYPGLQLGTSGHIGVAFGVPATNCVTVRAGETWHLSIRCTFDDGRPTAGPPLGIQITPGSPA